MNLANLNLNHLRTFESVARLESMTKAAGELHLTQSGVSQNIKALEELLGLKLFDRFKGRLILTEEAERLFLLVKVQLHDLEEVLAMLMGEDLDLRGTIAVGVPIEYGNRFIMPLAAEFAKEHNLVNFEFNYGHAAQMNELILDGELDYAIVDDYAFSPQIELEDLDYEAHILCAHKEYLEKFGTIQNNATFFKKLDYITYLPSYPVLNRWFRFHLGRELSELKIRSSQMDVQGVEQLIRHGLGAGILPYHVVKAKKNKDLYLFKGKGKHYKNTLSLASLKGKSHSYVVKKFRDFLKEKLATRKKSGRIL